MKGYIRAVPTSVLSLQRLSAFASEDNVLNMTICKAQVMFPWFLCSKELFSLKTVMCQYNNGQEIILRFLKE